MEVAPRTMADLFGILAPHLTLETSIQQISLRTNLFHVLLCLRVPSSPSFPFPENDVRETNLADCTW